MLMLFCFVIKQKFKCMFYWVFLKKLIQNHVKNTNHCFSVGLLFKHITRNHSFIKFFSKFDFLITMHHLRLGLLFLLGKKYDSPRTVCLQTTDIKVWTLTVTIAYKQVISASESSSSLLNGQLKFHNNCVLGSS